MTKNNFFSRSIQQLVFVAAILLGNIAQAQWTQTSQANIYSPVSGTLSYLGDYGHGTDNNGVEYLAYTELISGGSSDLVRVKRYNSSNDTWEDFGPTYATSIVGRHPRIAFDANNDLYIAFIQITNIMNTNSIIVKKYDNSTQSWSSVFGTSESPVSAIAISLGQNAVMDIDFAGNTPVVAIQTGNTTINCFTYNGSTWSGTLTNSANYNGSQVDLAKNGSSVYFFYPNSSNNIQGAVFNGSSWSSLSGSATFGSTFVYKIITKFYGSDIYIGAHSLASNNYHAKLFKYSSSTYTDISSTDFSTAGTVFNGFSFDLTPSGDPIVAYCKSSTTPANGYSAIKYSSGTWSSLCSNFTYGSSDGGFPNARSINIFALTNTKYVLNTRSTTSTIGKAFIYNPPSPSTITSISSASGAVGASITITGTNLSDAASVSFNGTIATTFTVNSATSISATVPVGATSGSIIVNTPCSSATSATSFTVLPPAPTISSFTPTSATVGATVTLTGTNFTGATAVSFNGTAATTYSVVSATSITATVPTGASTGTISVTTAGGTATSASSLTLPAVPPTITSFSPTSGAAGTQVTITGTGFDSSPSNNVILLDGMRCTVSSATSTSLSVIIPKGTTNNYFQVVNVTNKLSAISKLKFSTKSLTLGAQVVANSFYLNTPTSLSNISVTNVKNYSTADIDADGKLDILAMNNGYSLKIASTSSTPSSLIYTLNTITNSVLPVANAVRYAQLIDFNNDGLLDFMTTEPGTSSTGGWVNINSSTSGTPSFASRYSLTPSLSYNFLATDVITSDLNNDGKIDILGGYRTDQYFTFCKNNSSNGIFSEASTRGQGASQSNIVTAMIEGEFTGDSKVDFIVLHGGSVANVVTNNTTSGANSLSISVSSDINLSANLLKSSDLDNDGDLDLIGSNIGGSSLFVLTNNGTGTFTISTISIPSGVLRGVELGDLNEDGAVDIIYASSTGFYYVANTTSSSNNIIFNINNNVLLSNSVTNYGFKLVDLNEDDKFDILYSTGSALNILINKIGQIPTITTSSNLSAFTTCPNSASLAQRFKVSATNLTANITVAALTGYEFSLDSSNYSSTVSIPYGSGTLSDVSVHVRLSSSATGTPSGSISLSSTGATTQTVAVTGSVTTNQPFANALALNGTGKIQFGNQTAAAVSTNFTIEAWVNVPSSAWSLQTVLSNSPTPSSLPGFKFAVNNWQTNDGKIVLEGSNTFLSSATAVTKDVWQHVAVVVNGTNVTFYINGNISGSYTGSFNATSAYPLTIGDFSGGSYPFNGTMDELRLWNVSKSQQDIQAAMYTPLVGNESGLAAYFNFNQGTPGGTNTGITNLLDNGPNAFTGSLSEITRTGTAENFVLNTNTMGIIGSLACVGSTVQLNHPQSGGTWTSVTTSVATVSSTGLVTCLTAGSSVITYAYTYNGCQFTNTYTVTVNATPTTPTVANTTISYCQNGNATALSATAAASHSLRWYTVATGGTGSATAITPVTSTAGTFTYYVSQANASGCEGPRVAITVTVSPVSVAGTASVNLASVCGGSTVDLSLTGNTGTIQWQSSPNNSTWTNISGATAATYTTTALNATTYFRAVVTSGACSAANSNVLTVTVTTIAVPTTTTSITECQGNTATQLSATALSGHTLQWYTVSTGGTASSTAITPDLSNAAVTTYYVSQLNNTSNCESARVPIVVTVYALPAAPTTTTTINYCKGATPSALTATATSGLNLQWYTTATGGTASNTAPTPTTSTVGTTTYYVSQKANAGSYSLATGNNGTLSSMVQNLGQTFQVANNIVLNTINFDIIFFYSPAPVTLKIYNGFGGALIATANSVFNPGYYHNYNVQYSFSGQNLQLNAGQTYYMELTSSQNMYVWLNSNVLASGVTYSNGVAQAGNDFGFTLAGTLNVNPCESPRTAITVNVNDLPTISGVQNMTVGGSTLQLTGSGTPNANSPWTSSNTSTATISATGEVTAVAGGSTLITYTNADGCSISQSITVVDCSQPLGNVLHFDGVNDYITTASNIPALNITADLTLETWIKFDQVHSDFVRLIGKGDANNRTYGLWLQTDGKLLFQINGTPTGLNFTSTTSLQPGIWYHIAAIRNGNTAKIFINGVEDATATTTVSPQTNTFPLTVGYGTIHNYLKGSLEDVRVWNIARTVSQIQQGMYNSIDGNETGLVAYYDFNQGIASGNNTTITTANDKSLNALNATLTNFGKTGGTSNFIGNTIVNFAVSGASIVCANSTSQFTHPRSGGTWSISNGASASINSSGLVTTLENENVTVFYTYTINGCSVTDSKSVSINTPTAPVVTSPVNLCQGVTATALTATPASGSNLLWYTAATGGTASSTAPTPSTTTVGSTTYYVSQKAPSGPYIIDNVYNYNYANNISTFGQTFTPANNIILNSITLKTAYINTNTPNIVLKIYNGYGGALLATANSPFTSSYGYTWFNDLGFSFSGQNLVLTGGQTYYLEFVPNSTMYPGYSNAYANGTGYINGSVISQDFAFKLDASINSNPCESPRTAIVVNVNAIPTITGAQNMTVGGATLQLTGSGTPNANSPWTSSNTAVATISATGEVTAVAGGSTTITYTNSDGCSITAAINVIDCSQPFGNALSFGVGTIASNADFVEVNSRIFPTQTVANFTIETWIKASASDIVSGTPGGSWFGFLGNQNSQRNPSMWITNSGALHASWWDNGYAGTPVSASTPSSLIADKWTHVALVKDGTTMRIYANGIQVNSAACSPTITVPNNTYWFGKVDNQFNGSLDEVRFWSTARTQAQIAASMYTELVGNEAGLLANFDFNQGIANGNNTAITTVINKANSALNGTLTNFTKTGTSSNFVANSITSYPITGAAIVCANSTAQYTHPVSGGTWTISNGANATISNSGLLTTAANENVTVSYTYTINGCSKTATLQVTIETPAAPVATTAVNLCQGITASALSATALTGNTLQWYTVATGGTASLTAPNPSIASLGVTMYYVSQKNNTTTCESPRTAITVTVNAIPTITGVQNMTLGGSTLQLTGSGTPDATTPWSSTNTSVATISSTGEVTAVAGGTSVITYTTASGCSITTTVKVTDCAAPFGNALNFDGVNDYAVVDNVGNNSNLSFSGTSNFTIESWVKRENTNGIAMIFSKYNGGVAGNYWLGIDNTGKPIFSREASPWGVTATNPLPVNEWHHIAATYDGSQTKIYVDGVLNNTTSAPLSINHNISNIKVNIGAGLANNSPSYLFKGELDEIRVWNIARTATQIQQTYNATLQGNEAGLVAYYDFNHGIAGGNNTSVNTVVNTINSASNGTLTNFAKNGTTSNFVASTIANFPINGPASICAYSSAQYTHQISGGTWSLASGAAATISNTGLITSSANETVTINYTYSMNGCSVTVTKTVTIENPVISGLATVAAGEQITLTATTTPATNNAWVSTNTSKLSVTSAGVVTGLAPGTASVIYTNNLGCKDTLAVTVTVGTTLAPTLTSPATNTTGATTLNIVYSLPEAPLAGSVTLTFTPVGGGTPIVWTMNNATSANFNYVVGTNPVSSNVTAGAALGFTTYNVTLAYQDAYANPAATVTNTNIQTLAPPLISFVSSSYATVVNSTLTINTINTGGSMVTYSISPALPSGFTFNTTTGVITGSSTVAFNAINYTVTATNAAGTSTATVSIAITADTDGDGIPDIADADVNGDGVIDNGPDTDGDGIIDLYDNDIDGDGIPNNLDNDADGDGVPNSQDVCAFIPNTAISVQPSTTNQVICPSATISPLTVTATGPGLSYQWYRNTTATTTGGTLLTGATSASYSPLNTVVGTVYYYVVVTGTCGTATSNVSGSILVTDITLPTVVTQNRTIYLNASGQATITAAQIDNGSTDNCAIATRTLSQTTFNCNNVGANTVTLTVTDASGNIRTGNATVTVVDSIKPTVVTQNITVNLNASGQATITAAQINNGSSDNCGIASVTVNQTAFTCANTGANTVTLTVTDVNGNVKTKTATVTVVDNILPTVVTQNVIRYLNASGQVTVTANDINNGSTDNCGIGTLALSQTAFTCAHVGVNTVTLTVTDTKGNTATGQATVTIIDNTPPTAIAQNINAYLNAGGAVTVTPNQVGGNSTDNCSIATMTLNNTTFNCSNLGANPVILTVVDPFNNVSTANAVITVVDSIKPLLTIPADITVNTNSGCGAFGFPIGTASATDNCSVISAITNNAPTFYPVGITNIVYSVTDGSGNTKTKIQKVTVIDNVIPIITAPASITTTLTAGCTKTGLNLGTPVTSDNCTIASVTNNAPTAFPVGTTTVTWTVTDASGNTATATQTVTVTDAINPTITAPANLTINANASCVAFGVNLGTPVRADNCTVASVTNNAPAVFPLGITTVTWIVTDGSGNTASANQQVNVIDNSAPTLVAPAALTVNANSGCTATGVNLGTAVKFDNCSIVSTTNNAPTAFPLGTTTVTWTVTDGSGNSTTATQLVTVIDNVNPTITAPAAVTATTNNGCTRTGLNLGTPVTADNCSVASVTNNAPTAFPIGTTIVTWTVTDGSGKTATATQTVTINDVIFPTITAPAAITANTTTGCIAANIVLGTPVTADNCSVATITNNAPALFPLGTTTVTWTVKDGSGNTTTATQTVTIVDIIYPTIVAPAAITVNTTTGCTAIGFSLGTPVTADNCSVATVTNNAPTSFPIGTTTVTWTVTDGSGNSTTATQLVTVIDNVNPTITAPSAVSANTTNGCTASGIILGTPITADNCTVASVTNNAPSVFPIGSTTVTWTVTDGSGNSATATQVVTVTDVTNPTITAPVAITVTTNSGCEASGIALGLPITADNCTVASVTNNAPATFPIGTTTVTWTVTDASGNTSTATQTVTVIDNINPSIIAPSAVTFYVSSGCSVNGIVIGTPVTADNCTVASVTNNAPATFPIGSTTVTWTVTDGAGNSAVATQVIQVIDTIAPTALVNDVTVALDLTGTATVTSSMIDAGSFDNCGLESIVLSQSLFGCNDLGTNVVQVTITDSYGNSTIAFVKVTITTSGIDVDMDGIDDACDEFVNTQIVQVPSGFSPNGDNINDTFIIPALDQFTKVQLQVYNKYGHEVYVSSLYKNDWDGTSSFNGLELPDDTYFYILNTDGELRQGYVYINRIK